MHESPLHNINSAEVEKPGKSEVTNYENKNERGDISTDFTENKRIIQVSYTKLYANKLDSLE